MIYASKLLRLFCAALCATVCTVQCTHAWTDLTVVTFHLRCSRGEMYNGHSCVCLSLAAFPHYCTDPNVTLGNGRGCSLVVYCWMDLELVHRFHCYDHIALNAKCQRVVITLCLVCWLDLAFLWLYCVLQFICVRFSFLGLFYVMVYLCVCFCCGRFKVRFSRAIRT